MHPVKCCQPQESAAVAGLTGPVTGEVLSADPAARRAEETGLRRGTVIYHYFDGFKQVNGQPLVKIIATERRVGSFPRCLSEAEIVASVREASETVRPHYGDGAYVTLHEDLVNAHPLVEVAHGISRHVARFRAVLRVEDPTRFRKFAATGGVIRSIPSAVWLRTDELITIGEDTGEARLLRIEQYDNGQWVPAQLP